MALKDFLILYDNWNERVRINDDELNKIIETHIINIIEHKKELHFLKVVSFGFYDNVLTIRVKARDCKW